MTTDVPTEASPANPAPEPDQSSAPSAPPTVVEEEEEEEEVEECVSALQLVGGQSSLLFFKLRGMID